MRRIILSQQDIALYFKKYLNVCYNLQKANCSISAEANIN